MAVRFPLSLFVLPPQYRHQHRDDADKNGVCFRRINTATHLDRLVDAGPVQDEDRCYASHSEYRDQHLQAFVRGQRVAASPDLPACKIGYGEQSQDPGCGVQIGWDRQ